ncbi:hypothetical protein RB195_017375 [Necator americanus]|uniref:Uncharacterized protein n=1 Tax=Necator americanus TaxID=51031 RepID=A0ABR1C4Y2_NECAM
MCAVHKVLENTIFDRLIKLREETTRDELAGHEPYTDGNEENLVHVTEDMNERTTAAFGTPTGVSLNLESEIRQKSVDNIMPRTVKMYADDVDGPRLKLSN